MPHQSPTARETAPRRRDRAQGRVRRTTRWVAALAVGGTAVLIGVAAHEVPAKPSTASTASGTSTGATSQGSSGTSSSTGTGAGGGGLSSPSTSPSASSGGGLGGVATGGS
jgi:hypothetical protein